MLTCEYAGIQDKMYMHSTFQQYFKGCIGIGIGIIIIHHFSYCLSSSG